MNTCTQIQVVRVGVTKGVARQNALSTRIDGVMEKISAAHGRLEAMSAQLEPREWHAEDKCE